MPLWPPAASASPQPKPPAEFLFDEGASSPQHPHAIPTGVVPTSANVEAPRTADKSDTLSDYVAELPKEQKSGQRRSHAVKRRADSRTVGRRAACVRGPNGPKQISTGRPTTRRGRHPSSRAPPIHIQPRGTPVPLFEPVEGIPDRPTISRRAPTIRFPPGPAPTEIPRLPLETRRTAGPEIHPRSSN